MESTLKYPCDTCNLRFVCVDQLLIHRSIQHGIPAMDSNVPKEKENPASTVSTHVLRFDVCDLCAVSLRTFFESFEHDFLTNVRSSTGLNFCATCFERNKEQLGLKVERVYVPETLPLDF